MSTPGAHHFSALAALASAKGDLHAISAAVYAHREALVEIVNGSQGIGLVQAAGALLDSMKASFADGALFLPTAAASGGVSALDNGPRSVSPPPAPSPPPAALATRSDSPSSVKAAPEPFPRPSATAIPSPKSTRTSRPCPLPGASHPRDDAGKGAPGEESMDLPLPKKRKRKAADDGPAFSASEASGTGRGLRDRKGGAVKNMPRSPRRAAQHRAKSYKGKKKTADARDDHGDRCTDREDSDDEVVIVYDLVVPHTSYGLISFSSEAPKNVKTLRMSVRKRTPSPDPSLVNDPPCANCLQVKGECLRRETGRAGLPCQRCVTGKFECSLAKAQGSARPSAPNGKAKPSPIVDNTAAGGASVSVIRADPYHALYAQDPLGLSQTSASLAELCGHMARFNDNVRIMEAVLGAINDFGTYVDMLTEYAKGQRCSEAVGSVTPSPPLQSPSVPLGDVSPASQESRKRRRIEPAAAASRGIAPVGGLRSLEGLLVGSWSEYEPWATAPAPGPSSEGVAPRSPHGAAARRSQVPARVSADASAKTDADAASENMGRNGGAAAPTEVDKPTTDWVEG
ncbi:hypothetical protein EV715DRAFT_267861 [Schizophyllum commune]